MGSKKVFSFVLLVLILFGFTFVFHYPLVTTNRPHGSNHRKWKDNKVKTEEKMNAEYREVISLLRKGYSIRLWHSFLIVQQIISDYIWKIYSRVENLMRIQLPRKTRQLPLMVKTTWLSFIILTQYSCFWVQRVRWLLKVQSPQ